MLTLDGDFILSIAPRFSGSRGEAQRRIVGGIAGAFADTLDRFSISTRLRVAHFMAQVTHECAGFSTTEEFASGAAYEGRKDLGNTERGDGARFKGRGLIQLTGRANYRRSGERLGLPLETEPSLAADPQVSLLIACDYWTWRGINEPADADDLVEVTRRVNGGTNGLDDRRRYLKKAKAVLADMVGRSAACTASPLLARGSHGEAVGGLQRLLRAHGFPVAVDNEFRPATELAVRLFQTANRLVPDGLVGERSWSVLRAVRAVERLTSPVDI